jgi:antitoxin component YwqK of YwqJK toxin-antitoxin module
MKRGGLTVDEWYYPSGSLQKRFVADKSGYAVEPVRWWHPNGQLAEEVHVQGRDKRGPWLTFFEDGSLRLQAEYREGEMLVVYNAWDEQRHQVVKDGRGTFYDDGRCIDVSYRLVFESDWTREQELRDGIPHGRGTTWHAGVLWSRQEYAKGKLHGVQTLYYDNGRVRTRSTYHGGEQVKVEEFPKFDDPRPAVLLRDEANAELYEAWGHPLLDVYPAACNLEQVQPRLEVPSFLTEVFERNRAGKRKEEYESLNTFDDSIAYMVMVKEDGTVASVGCSGASPYSGSMIDAYPPMIRELKFAPGRKQGRAVGCRVVVWVRHTFVEAETPT